MGKRTGVEREALRKGWSDAVVHTFTTPSDDGSAAYAEGWIRGAFSKTLGILREIGVPGSRIETLATLEARLPPVDGSY